MSRVIIIGSGISGLTAALLLHRRGYEVLVVEQQALAGGALHRFRRHGMSFDVGFHYTGGLGEGEILRLLWRYCGIESDIPVLPFPEESADCLKVDGLAPEIRAYFSYRRFGEELAGTFPREKEGINRFFKVIREQSDSIPFYNMSRPLTEFLRELTFPEQKTLGDLVRSCTTDPCLQAALSHPVFLHGVQPDTIGLTMHTAVAHPLYTGMYTIDGGGQAIADAYLGKLSDWGIEVLTGTRVETVATHDNRVRGIVTDRGEYEADDVIYTGHPALLPDMVGAEGLRKAYRDRLRDMDNTPSMFMVFGAIDEQGCDPRLRWNNYYALPGGLETPWDGRERQEDCFFLSGCGLRDRASRNGRERSVILMRPAVWEEAAPFDLGRKKRTGAYRSWKEREGRKLVASVNRQWDGLLDTFQVINTASPLTFRDELRYVRGSVYGVQHSTQQFAVGARTRLSGLWLSGQSTFMTGILGAALSALITVGGMVGLEPLWEKVKNCR